MQQTLKTTHPLPRSVIPPPKTAKLAIEQDRQQTILLEGKEFLVADAPPEVTDDTNDHIEDKDGRASRRPFERDRGANSRGGIRMPHPLCQGRHDEIKLLLQEAVWVRQLRLPIRARHISLNDLASAARHPNAFTAVEVRSLVVAICYCR